MDISFNLVAESEDGNEEEANGSKTTNADKNAATREDQGMTFNESDKPFDIVYDKVTNHNKNAT